MKTLKQLAYWVPVFGLIANKADEIFGWSITKQPEGKLINQFLVAWHFIFALGLIFG